MDGKIGEEALEEMLAIEESLKNVPKKPESSTALREKKKEEYKEVTEFLNQIAYHISDETMYLLSIPAAEEVIKSWGDEGVSYLAKVILELDDILLNSLRSSFEIRDQSTFEFILKNLPNILKNNREEISWEDYISQVETGPLITTIHDLLKVIEAEEKPVQQEWGTLKQDLSPEAYASLDALSRMYGSGPVEKFGVARSNLHQLPVVVLNKENIFGSPRDDWSLFNPLFDWIAKREENRQQELFDSLVMAHDHYAHQDLLVGNVLGDMHNLQGIIRENIILLTYWSVQDKYFMVENGASGYRDHRKLAVEALDFYQAFQVEQPSQAHKVFSIPLAEKNGPYFNFDKLNGYLKAVTARTSIVVDPQLEVPWQLEAQFRGEQLKGVREYARISAESIHQLLLSYKNIASHLSQSAIRKVQKIYFDEWEQKRNSGTLEKTVITTLSKLRFEEFSREVRDVWDGNPSVETLATMLTNLRNPEYYFQNKLSEKYSDALNRLLVGLQGNFSFDSIQIEQNKYALHDLVNLVGDCLSFGGNYEQYGFASSLDIFQGILALNIYQSGSYQDTIGKGFLAECLDQDGNKVMYIDGVIINEDIQDMLRKADANEAAWMPLYTKAFLRNALKQGYASLVMNTQHKSSQLSTWAYLNHFAEFIGLQKKEEYTYKDPKTVVELGVTKERDVTNREGFMLTDKFAKENVYYLEKAGNGDGSEEYFLAGYWINHWRGSKGGFSHIQPGCLPEDRAIKSEKQVINNGKGYIIGLRRSTDELIERFNEKYGKEYGLIKLPLLADKT